MFAKDVGLLPDRMFTRMLKQARRRPDEFAELARDLFGAMAVGGPIGFESVAWFNGGLFDDDSALPLNREGIETALKAAALDWSEIDPSILGTLFERGLDPDKRLQLGAHYTDRDKIRQADIIRLLLLTGCRRGEILTMRWQDIDGDTLNLGDTKTGPRRVFLNAPAPAILERQPQSESAWVFPSPADPTRPLSHDLPLWYAVRKEAGSRTYVCMICVTGLPATPCCAASRCVSRILGHKRPSITMRYAHVGDKEIEAAAERIGTAIARALDGSEASSNLQLDAFVFGSIQ